VSTVKFLDSWMDGFQMEIQKYTVYLHSTIDWLYCLLGNSCLEPIGIKASSILAASVPLLSTGYFP
jgi:hypothetical protein